MRGPVVIRDLHPEAHLLELLRWCERFFSARALECPPNPMEILARDLSLAGALRPSIAVIMNRISVRRTFVPTAEKMNKAYDDTGVDVFVLDNDEATPMCSNCNSPTLRTVDDRQVCFFCTKKIASEYEREIQAKARR